MQGLRNSSNTPTFPLLFNRVLAFCNAKVMGKMGRLKLEAAHNQMEWYSAKTRKPVVPLSENSNDLSISLSIDGHLVGCQSLPPPQWLHQLHYPNQHPQTIRMLPRVQGESPSECFGLGDWKDLGISVLCGGYTCTPQDLVLTGRSIISIVAATCASCSSFGLDSVVVEGALERVSALCK